MLQPKCWDCLTVKISAENWEGLHLTIFVALWNRQSVKHVHFTQQLTRHEQVRKTPGFEFLNSFFFFFIPPTIICATFSFVQPSATPRMPLMRDWTFEPISCLISVYDSRLLASLSSVTVQNRYKNVDLEALYELLRLNYTSPFSMWRETEWTKNV